MSSITFTLNGRTRTLAGNPMTRLLDALRSDLRLTGTKEGCGEGECGSCAVLLDGVVVCSCLVPIFQCDGRDVRTVEGLATDAELDDVQRAMIDEGGVQCGACTPGIVLTARALLDRNPHPSTQEVREALAGNLCRCTGYERVFRSVLAAASAAGARPR